MERSATPRPTNSYRHEAQKQEPGAPWWAIPGSGVIGAFLPGSALPRNINTLVNLLGSGFHSECSCFVISLTIGGSSIFSVRPRALITPPAS